MKIKSSQSAGHWIEVQQPAGDIPDPAAADIRRVLSSAVRAQNLVILTGLGTSLCVLKDGERAAPTMWNLLSSIKEVFNTADIVDGAGEGARWKSFVKLANVGESTQDLEQLMSRATTAADFLPHEEATKVRVLLDIAEGIIRDEVEERR